MIHHLMKIDLIFDETKNRKITDEEIKVSEKATLDLFQDIMAIIWSHNQKNHLAHVNVYGNGGDPCPTNVSEDQILN